PFSAPCTATAFARLRPRDPAACGTWPENGRLCRSCPMRSRPQSCVSGDWAAQAVPRRRRRVDREGPQVHGPFSPASRSPEPCGRFRRERCNNAEGQCAFRCPLEKTSFLDVVPEGGHRLSCRGLSHPQEQKGQPGSFAGPCPTLSSALPSC